jgi:hypothetical protein
MQKEILKIKAPQIYTKTLAHPKTLAPGKNLAHAKNLAHQTY